MYVAGANGLKKKSVFSLKRGEEKFLVNKNQKCLETLKLK